MSVSKQIDPNDPNSDYEELSSVQVNNSGTAELSVSSDEYAIGSSDHLRLLFHYSAASAGTGTPGISAKLQITRIIHSVITKVVQSYVTLSCDTDGNYSSGYRFGFNGQLKDNEIAGVGNSLDFGARTYDSRLARFSSIDPLNAKFPGNTSYSFSANNPILMIDKEGREGVIYLVVLPGADKTAAIKIQDAANVSLKNMGLTTRVKIFQGNSADFRLRNLDHTDAVAALGSNTAVSAFAGQLIGPDKANAIRSDFANGLSESSDSYGISGGNLIALSVNNIKTDAGTLGADFATTGAFALLHGAGHTADKETKLTRHSEGAGFALRWSGGHVRSALSGSSYFPDFGNPSTSSERVSNLSDLMNNQPLAGTPRNQGYLGLMQKRYGSQPAQDNYGRNEAGWKAAEKTYGKSVTDQSHNMRLPAKN